MSQDVLYRPVERVQAVYHHSLLDDIKHRHDLDLIPGPLAMRLTCRAPWQDGIGGMDFYQPGRWDTESDMVFMTAIVDGPSPGMWDGTAGYAHFTPPAPGNYLVAWLFTGNGTTASMYGPWGTASHSVPSGNHPVGGTVTALWSCAAGDPPLYFSFNLREGIIGYLNALEVHAL